MANFVYNRGRVVLGEYDWRSAAGNTFRVLLATSSYTPALADNVVTVPAAFELSGGGYSRILSLTTRTVTQDDPNSRANYAADCPTWSGLTSTQSVKWAVVYRFGTNDADSDLICALDMGGVLLTGLTSWTLQFDGQATNGRIFSVT
jgi:hypothetical protein